MLKKQAIIALFVILIISISTGCTELNYDSIRPMWEPLVDQSENDPDEGGASDNDSSALDDPPAEYSYDIGAFDELEDEILGEGRFKIIEYASIDSDDQIVIMQDTITGCQYIMRDLSGDGNGTPLTPLYGPDGNVLCVDADNQNK